MRNAPKSLPRTIAPSTLRVKRRRLPRSHPYALSGQNRVSDGGMLLCQLLSAGQGHSGRPGAQPGSWCKRLFTTAIEVKRPGINTVDERLPWWVAVCARYPPKMRDGTGTLRAGSAL
jgi:hypothetical protein